jgi:hypothetical protein
MMMKMMTKVQNFRIYKAFVNSGTVLYFALSVFVCYSPTFSTDAFLLGYSACMCMFDITWCSSGTDTNQNFESKCILMDIRSNIIWNINKENS